MHINEFLIQSKQYPILDVRSPSEYAHAHIPGAISFPLFNDEERAKVGTLYKQTGRQEAVKVGLEIFGPNMVSLVEEAESIATAYNTKTLLVHCWRGGMRSGAIAWLLQLYGFDIYTLSGGYKSFRKWCLAQFSTSWPLKVLGGYTCSAKTEILYTLEQNGQAIIDLEKIAHHKGSAFGALGEAPQPTQEMFENKLSMQLWHTYTLQNPKPACIWIEDESQRIGNINLPIDFFNQKQTSPLFFLEIPFETRLKYCIANYGIFEKDELLNAILRISKRLGGLETKTAVAALSENDYETCFTILLQYYDKWYLKSLNRKENHQELMRKVSIENLQEFLENS